MKIKIFENKSRNEYYIDDNSFEVFGCNKLGKYHLIKPLDYKYGKAVQLSIFSDEDTNRIRTRGIYLAYIVGIYVFKLKRKFIIEYKDGNCYNFTKNNITFTYASDVSNTWKQMEENKHTFINDDGIIFNDWFASYIKPSIDVTGYYSYSIGSVIRKRSHLVWKYFNGSEIPKGYVIDHIDNNCQNDNINNLQCITIRENIAKEASKKRELPTGVIKKGNKYGAYITYTIDDIKYIGKYLGQFNTIQEASDTYQRALSMVEQGINPIKSGDEANIKYKFATDKWYFNMPQYNAPDKYYGDYNTYEEALLSYNKYFTLDKVNENEIDTILRRGYFTFKVNDNICYEIRNNKYTTKAYIKAYNFYKECREKRNINLLVEKLDDIRKEIEDEGNEAKLMLDEKERLHKEKIKIERQKELENRKRLQIEYEDKKRIENVNKPNYTSHTYNNGNTTYIFSIPYSDGKSYYLGSFMDKSIVDEIDSIMNTYKVLPDFIEWFNDFKLNELNKYNIQDKLYRNMERSKETGACGYKWYSPRNCWRVRKKINNKDYILGYFDDERCCKTIVAEANIAISNHSFDLWYKDIENHKMRIRRMFNDASLNSSVCKHNDDIINGGVVLMSPVDFDYKQTAKRVVVGGKKKVNQIKDGKVINTFNSLAEANKQFNNKYGDKAISKCCIGKTKSYQGYQWEYVS